MYSQICVYLLFVNQYIFAEKDWAFPLSLLFHSGQTKNKVISEITSISQLNEP